MPKGNATSDDGRYDDFEHRSGLGARWARKHSAVSLPVAVRLSASRELDDCSFHGGKQQAAGSSLIG